MEDSRTYEISFLLRQEQNIEILMAALKNIGAEIINEGQITEIKLAYPIRKMKSAHFGYLIFEALPSRLKELRDALMLDEDILRFLIVTPPIRKPLTQLVKNEAAAGTETVLPGEEDKMAPGRREKQIEQVSNEELNKKLEEILS